MDNRYNRTTYVELDHNEIHITSGLLSSLIEGKIDSPSTIDFVDLEALHNKFYIAHERVKDN